jgi:predicted dehydrogenase
LKTLLEDQTVDGVMLVLPVTTQMVLIPKCLAAGKHVLSEKPMAKDVESARSLVEKYEKVYKPKGLVWRVAEGKCPQPKDELFQSSC